jgi:hypothetical protein
MGIYYYFSQFIQKVGTGVVSRSPPTAVEGIIFDLNGLIHPVTQKIFLYREEGIKPYKTVADYKQAHLSASSKSYDSLILECGKEIVKTINEVLQVLKPRQYLIIAVDGIAPGAKISQQRRRRFESAGSDNEEEQTEQTTTVKNVAKRLGPVHGFSSVVISPGTPFMQQIDNYLRAWTNEALRPGAVLRGGTRFGKSDPKKSLLPPVFVYSSHLVNGEGEHKAFSALRELVQDFSIVQGTGNHIVYGKDADLSMLCLLAPVRNMVLSRESLTENVNIDEFFKRVMERMTNSGTSQTSRFGEEVLRRDFVVLAMLLGNDFLPRSPSISNLNDRIFAAYRLLQQPLTIHNPPELPELNLQSLGNLFALLASTDTEELTLLVQKEIEEEGTPSQRVAPSKALRLAYEPLKGKIDFSNYRKTWYKSAADMRNITGGAGTVSSTLEVMKEMTCAYIGAIGWTFRYYVGGGDRIHWLFRYPYAVAPLFIDLANSLLSSSSSETLVEFFSKCKKLAAVSGLTEADGPHIGRGSSAIAPVHQLLAITPPSLIEYVIPKAQKLTALVKPSGQLSYLSPPGKVEVYLDGKRKAFEGVLLLPDIDLAKLNETLFQIDKQDKDLREAALSKKRAISNALRVEQGEWPRNVWPAPPSIIPREIRSAEGEEPVIITLSDLAKEANAVLAGFDRNLARKQITVTKAPPPTTILPTPTSAPATETTEEIRFEEKLFEFCPSADLVDSIIPLPNGDIPKETVVRKAVPLIKKKPPPTKKPPVSKPPPTIRPLVSKPPPTTKTPASPEKKTPPAIKPPTKRPSPTSPEKRIPIEKTKMSKPVSTPTSKAPIAAAAIPTKGRMFLGSIGGGGKPQTVPPPNQDKVSIIDVSSTSSYRFKDENGKVFDMKSVSPSNLHVVDTRGTLFENWWQGGKVWKSHLFDPDDMGRPDEQLQVNEAWMEYNDAIVDSPIPIRNPQLKYDLTGNPVLGYYQQVFYTPLSSRYQYAKVYQDSVFGQNTGKAAIHHLRALLDSGSDVLLLDTDGPPASTYPNGVSVSTFEAFAADDQLNFGHLWLLASLSVGANPQNIIGKLISTFYRGLSLKNVIQRAEVSKRPVEIKRYPIKVREIQELTQSVWEEK